MDGKIDIMEKREEIMKMMNSSILEK